MTTTLKTCFKCHAEKPLGEFYKHRMMKDGHLNKCKDCTKKDARERRFDPKSRTKVLSYDRERGNRQGKAYQDEYRARNPKANRARAMVRNAVRSGRIERPDRCAHCKNVGPVHGHHHDYDRPLDVTWLCAACHRQLHALLETVEKATA